MHHWLFSKLWNHNKSYLILLIYWHFPVITASFTVLFWLKVQHFEDHAVYQLYKAPSFAAWHSFILFAWNFTQRCYCMCPLIEQSLNKICQLSKCNVTLSDVALWGSLSWRCGKWWDCEIDSSLLHCPFLISFFFLIELNEYYYRAMRPTCHSCHYREIKSLATPVTLGGPHKFTLLQQYCHVNKHLFKVIFFETKHM